MAAITIDRLVSTAERQLFVVGKLRELTQPFKRESIAWDKALGDATERATTWISTTSTTTDKLLEAASHHLERHRNQLGDLFMFRSPRVATLPGLHTCFNRVSGQIQGSVALPPRELAEVLKARQLEARDLFIGGSYDATTGTLTLTRGDFDSLVVPVSIFKPSGTTNPDPRRLSFTDYGHTVRLGDYEAAADSILYEVDPEYRKDLNKKRRQAEKGFGPSLRRLRIQKRLTQANFPGVASKTIARIERGEVVKPRGRTLATIARTLGMDPEEIESF